MAILYRARTMARRAGRALSHRLDDGQRLVALMEVPDPVFQLLQLLGREPWNFAQKTLKLVRTHCGYFPGKITIMPVINT
jgi:hypothetical protein